MYRFNHMNAITHIKGFADLFPPYSQAMTKLEQAAQDIFQRYGYQELRLPLLEKTELFCRSIGEETDVVGKEMYTFPDQKGRSLTLRPEATAGVVRAYIEGKIYTQASSSKFYTFGPMFRYERPQRGRVRQFHQINAECLGLAEPHIDAEIIAMLWDLIQTLGIGNLSLLVNSLGCRECRANFRTCLTEFFHDLDHNGLCKDCRHRIDANPLRVLDCKVPSCQTQIVAAPSILEANCPSCNEHFAVVLRLLKQLDIPYMLTPRLVRGLDYYCRTTFEIVSNVIGAQSSVAGGGRYDGLVANLGGPDIPGIGFACGMERLVMLLPQLASHNPHFFIAVLHTNAQDSAFLLGQQLRHNGLRGIIGHATKSLKSQLRAANKLNAATCLLFGANELDTSTIQIKSLRTATQIVHPLQDLTGLVALLRSLADTP
ncbi:Histidine--tRNA ligase [Desulfovibrionales bacterium]